MPDFAWPVRGSTPRNPWFRQHPSIALVVAAGLCGVVLLLTLFAGTPGDDYFLLYVFPVAFIAITFGLRAGAVAGLTAIAFGVVWVVLRDVSLTAAGWVARVAAAQWSFQAGEVDAGLKILDETLGQAHELVSDLIRRAGMSGPAEPPHS